MENIPDSMIKAARIRMDRILDECTTKHLPNYVVKDIDKFLSEKVYPSVDLEFCKELENSFNESCFSEEARKLKQEAQARFRLLQIEEQSGPIKLKTMGSRAEGTYVVYETSDLDILSYNPDIKVGYNP